MKLVQSIKNILPVSRKAHVKAIQQSEMDQKWMLTQLKQVTAANIKLEQKLAKKEVEGL